MKQSGLSNRFPPEVRNEWLYWYECMICGKNQIDTLHHIISPSVRFYVRGIHNTSVFNSCPIHNYGCHINNEAYLYNDEGVRALLKKTKDALDDMGYTLKPVDREFLKIYGELLRQN